MFIKSWIHSNFKVFCDLFKPSQKSIYSVDLTVVYYLSYVGDDFSQIFCDRGWLWLGIWHHNNLNQRQKRNLRSIFFQECHTRRSRGSKRSTIRWNIFSGSNEMFFNDYFINLQTNQITNMVWISCQYVRGGFTNSVTKSEIILAHCYCKV